MNVPGITGQADAKLKESHHLFRHGLEVNLSSHVMDLSFAYGPSRTSRQKIKTGAVRKKIISRWGGGRKVYAKQVWVYGVSVLCRAAAPRSFSRPSP